MKIKSILVSQNQPENERSPYAELSKKYNVRIDFKKFFKIEGIPAKDFRKDRINILDHTAVIFNSKNGVDNFFRICTEMRITVPDTMKYFCSNESTALYLQKYVLYRKRKIFHAKLTFNQLIELIKKHRTEKFLIPCPEIHSQELPNALDELQIEYTKAIMYKTECVDLKDMNVPKYDMLVLFSPNGVRSLFHNYPDYKQGNTVIAAFGETTANAVREAGLTLNLMAPTPEAPSMLAALDKFLSKTNKK